GTVLVRLKPLLLSRSFRPSMEPARGPRRTRTKPLPNRPDSVPIMHQSWSVSIQVTAALVLAGLLYLRGWSRLVKVWPGATPQWRAAAFFCGLLSVWLAVGSPLAMLDEELLTVHMVQHLLLMTVGSPLILLGSPVLSLRHGFPKFLVRVFLDPLFRLAPVPRLGRFLANPVFCW